MSSSDIAIRVESISKRFELYDAPRDQLKQFILPKIQRLAGLESKQYFREFWALKDISFEVKKGESIGIVGRNGSGKSTLLQIIAGTLAPTTGSVSTYGRVAALLELGSGFNPDFTGRENIYLNGTLLGLTHRQISDRFDAIASFADIGEFLDQAVKTYSSGMLVRLAFAVQVQVDPDILIVDEALAVGDWLFQKRCFQRIEQLVSNGTTLLFVSHDQESVRTLTNNAMLLNRGLNAAYGLSSEVILEYRRILHEDEHLYYKSVTNSLAARTAHTIEAMPRCANQDTPLPAIQTTVLPPQELTSLRSVRLEFGDGAVKVVRVETLDGSGKLCSVYYPGDVMRIKVFCETQVCVTKLNIGVRLRNREGVKIYSWGTLNQDMHAMARHSDESVFWSRSFKAGEKIEVELDCICTLGTNLYEVQAYVSIEETPDFMSQRMLHWVDEAAFFQSLVKMEDYFFGGVVDLKMKASW